MMRCDAHLVAQRVQQGLVVVSQVAQRTQLWINRGGTKRAALRMNAPNAGLFTCVYKCTQSGVVAALAAQRAQMLAEGAVPGPS